MAIGVEYVRQICKEKGIPISKLEKELGFGNGYFNPRKLKKIPMEKAMAIADYLHCDVWPLLADYQVKEAYHYNVDFESVATAMLKQTERYHTFEDAQMIAQEIFDDENLRALFKAARGSKSEDLKMAKDLLERLKATNPDG